MYTGFNIGTVLSGKSPIFNGFTNLPTPTTGRVQLLFYWRVYNMYVCIFIYLYICMICMYVHMKTLYMALHWFEMLEYPRSAF